MEHSFTKAREFYCSKMCISIVEENTVLRKWYEFYGFVHMGTEKFGFFPFTCGYMEKMLVSIEILLIQRNRPIQVDQNRCAMAYHGCGAVFII